jgi:CDGSH-type Zn-finger protein
MTGALRIARNTPCKVENEAGKTCFMCACGKSANHPFCDGSHHAL